MVGTFIDITHIRIIRSFEWHLDKLYGRTISCIILSNKYVHYRKLFICLDAIIEAEIINGFNWRDSKVNNFFLK